MVAKLQITFFNVGHGTCTHIITPNNQHFLVDVGSNEGESVVNFINNYYGLQKWGKRIEYLVITHPHKDHILDLPNLLNSMSPRFLWRESDAFPIENAQTLSDWILFEKANEMNKKYCSLIDQSQRPGKPENNGGVYFTILPTPVAYHKHNDLNTYSPIIIINYKNRKIILTGDNNKEILKQWINESSKLREAVFDCDILLAPHHGRDSDFCENFFIFANPRLTVVSDKNKEHDTQSNTVNNYKGRGLFINGEERYVVTTRKDGNILVTIEEDGRLNVQLEAFDYGN